ncbi:MAG: response regulator transcription factor [Cytophagaceae bacterium]|nr:MAG: response regulator transcription factor [Cytophagaceae bacterium]
MPAKAATRILIVDDHPLVLSGCRSLLESLPNVEILGEVTEKSGFSSYQRQRPSIIIVDVNLPDLSGLELLRKIRKIDADAKVIMLSMHEDPGIVVRALELGAKGFISKSDDPTTILEAVKLVLRGETYLSATLAQSIAFSTKRLKANKTAQLKGRELEILRLLSKGYKISEVAAALDLSYKTIANSTTLLKQKLSARNHADLVRLAVEANLT